MKKTIITVFLILAVLVLVFLVWELFFAETGILHSIYNGAVSGINKQWQKVSGDKSEIIPKWDSGKSGGTHAGANKHTDGGFKIDIE